MQDFLQGAESDAYEVKNKVYLKTVDDWNGVDVTFCVKFWRYKIKVPGKFNAVKGVKFFLYIGDWSNGMIGVSKTFGGSSILSSPADKKRQKPWIYKASGVFIYIRKVDLAVRLIV